MVPCARRTVEVDPVYGTPGVTTKMLRVDKIEHAPLAMSSADAVSFNVHGMVNTHIDAFSHNGYKGYAFNGHRFADIVNMEEGAKRLDATDLKCVVTRGVFVDVARTRGIRGLEPGDYVRPEEIAPTVERMLPGDAIVIRTGVTHTHGIAPEPGGERHGTIGGLHYECINMLGRAGCCVVASDSPSDVFPSFIPHLCEHPVHKLSLVFWGMPLVHNMDLEELGRVCAEQERTDFLFMVSALNIPRATGSLCTPVAVL